METLKEGVERLVEQLEPLHAMANLAFWNLATTGEKRHAQEKERAEVALRALYSQKKECQFLLQQPPALDPLLERQKLLLLNAFKEQQIPPEMIAEIVRLETEIEALYTTFRAECDGKTLSSNEIKKVLKESRDEEQRKKAWEASKQIGAAVEKPLLALVELRNRAAHIAGYADFYSMRLELQEIDQGRLFTLLDELETLTAPAWELYKARLDGELAKSYGKEGSALMPWHYHDPFFQEAPLGNADLDALYQEVDIAAVSRRFCAHIGLPVEDVLVRSDLYPRDKKNQHAFCLSVDRKHDVRVLCNLIPNAYWMGTQLHELGHAVYDFYLEESLPFLLRAPAHTSTTEGVAMLFGRLSYEDEFLGPFVGVKEPLLASTRKMRQCHLAAGLLVFVRWAFVMIHFERALYQEPTCDRNALWKKLVARFQYVPWPLSRNMPDWAAKDHLACTPVYYHNYVLGEMTASQLMHVMKKQGTLMTPSMGSFLKQHLFVWGARFPWEETVVQATGEPLEPHYFARDLLYATG